MKTALLSVWDKTGLVDLGRRLTAAGWRLIASGGTAQALEAAGLVVTPVERIAGEPEMLGGRVKTLHPAIHAGLLARDNDEDRAALRARGWPVIDLAVVNLYPFEQTVADPKTTRAEAIEHIDIGGVALLRAAAKNYARVAVLCDPADYPDDLAVLEDPDHRLRLARKAFALAARYDAAIEDYFAALCGEAAPWRLTLYPSLPLRYGENPHQQAVFYSSQPGGTPLNGRLLQGKPLSYNNLLDLDSAWGAVTRFAEPAVVVVKHASPCGIAVAARPEDAIGPALATDPISAFGGVIATNREVSAAFVALLGDLFVECIAAPSFSDEARALLAARKNLRLLQIPPTRRACGTIYARSKAATCGRSATSAIRRTRRPGGWSRSARLPRRRWPRCASPGRRCSRSSPTRCCWRGPRGAGPLLWASAAASPTGSTVCGSPVSGRANAPSGRCWPRMRSSPSPTACRSLRLWGSPPLCSRPDRCGTRRSSLRRMLRAWRWSSPASGIFGIEGRCATMCI